MIPIADVTCSKEEGKCKVWYLQSHKNGTTSIVVHIPIEDIEKVLGKKHHIELENELIELLKDSELEIESI